MYLHSPSYILQMKILSFTSCTSNFIFIYWTFVELKISFFFLAGVIFQVFPSVLQLWQCSVFFIPFCSFSGSIRRLLFWPWPWLPCLKEKSPAEAWYLCWPLVILGSLCLNPLAVFWQFPMLYFCLLPSFQSKSWEYQILIFPSSCEARIHLWIRS